MTPKMIVVFCDGTGMDGLVSDDKSMYMIPCCLNVCPHSASDDTTAKPQFSTYAQICAFFRLISIIDIPIPVLGGINEKKSQFGTNVLRLCQFSE